MRKHWPTTCGCSNMKLIHFPINNQEPSKILKIFELRIHLKVYKKKYWNAKYINTHHYIHTMVCFEAPNEYNMIKCDLLYEQTTHALKKLKWNNNIIKEMYANAQYINTHHIHTHLFASKPRTKIMRLNATTYRAQQNIFFLK